MGIGNVENRGRRIVGILGGPTGSGKTAVAVAVARELGLEILSCDSGQSRRGMEIGTAAPGPSELAAARHHLTGILSPAEPDSVAAWLDRAAEVLRVPGPDLFAVGGTGQYLLALARGIDPVPAPDPELRAQLQSRWETEGFAPLWRELTEMVAEPPHDARSNPVRLLRALEKAILLVRGAVATGRPALAPDAPRFALALDRAALHKRLERRLDQMLAAGWREEVRELSSHPPQAPCWKCIGYPELREAAGVDPLPFRTRQRILEATRQYAKRQETWLRNKMSATWIPADRPTEEIASDLVGRIRGARP